MFNFLRFGFPYNHTQEDSNASSLFRRAEEWGRQERKAVDRGCISKVATEVTWEGHQQTKLNSLLAFQMEL